MDFYRELNDIMTCDKGGRGLHLPMPDLQAVARTLLSARRVLILTGFPVLAADGTFRGETDGPSGAAEIACVLARLGIPVTLATDGLNLPLVRAAVSAFAEAASVPVVDAVPAAAVVPASSLAAGTQPAPSAPESSQNGPFTDYSQLDSPNFVEILEIPAQNPDDFAKNLLKSRDFSHLISLERPGKAADGHFHSMKGRILDPYLTDTDPIFSQFPGVTISVGDGGNELGMGKYFEKIAKSVPFGEKIAAKCAADHVLCAGVSNWWGPGLAALLSFAAACDLLAASETEARALQGVLAAGGVDGCTGKCELSVDGLPLEVNLERRALVRALLAKYLPRA